VETFLLRAHPGPSVAVGLFAVEGLPIADDCRLIADACERRLRSSLHGEPSMCCYTDPQQLWWQSYCNCRPQTMEQFIIMSQRCGINVQSVPAVTEDILFV